MNPNANSHPPRRKPYRIIYQADTSWGMQNSRDAADYLSGMVDFLDTTHVDALFWHDGSGGNNAYYDSEVMELNGARIGKVEPLLLQMIEEGNDPPAITLKAARERGVDVFYSFRINDCHDSLDDGKAMPQLLATFKLEHPEWLIGKGHPYGGIMQLNFAVPEVREFKFAIIEEAARKYDFDGFEIDFQRSAPYFIPGTEPENAPILTDFLRRVRDHLKQRGSERGRSLALAVRVPESMEACRLNGFDVAAWVQEDLVDMIILGSSAIDIEVEAFKALTQGTDILVYPCLYGWPSGYGKFTTEMCRALATNYWFQGADGIYTFNWNAHTYTQRPDEEHHGQFGHQMELLREIDEPEQLRGKDKEFAADRVGGRRNSFGYIWSYPHNWMHCVLPAVVDSSGTSGEPKSVVVPILVGEDLESPRPSHVQLRVEMVEQAHDELLGLAINGQGLTKQDREGVTITAPVDPDCLTTGRNQVEVTAVAGIVEVTKMWIDVSY